jgi:hypothetical protein
MASAQRGEAWNDGEVEVAAVVHGGLLCGFLCLVEEKRHKDERMAARKGRKRGELVG